ncbi:hypothetical protein FG475_07005 [Vibrio navarrensis]|uniref:hypothetical protein n=1 Tax=Vibrio navarrensis TaxID=29495 RepID=UPI00186A59C4|nr:hypothetical protein [Vibrio navarrensis]EJL6396642.1 hypothetical protein [Vibrio navarrensis]EJL6400230.1 hypothetical protein [Vibrio navarrensis]EJL6565619.1 hypothetical protein [Vibrio navarrensis]MBE4618474.1 hypothetical protein [Vibrio navarrensis]
MAISGIHSGYQMIQQSNRMAGDAAVDLNKNSLPSSASSSSDPLAFNRVDAESKPAEGKIDKANFSADHTDALMKLNQAARYNRIGATVIERNNDVIGSLLDIQV